MDKRQSKIVAKDISKEKRNKNYIKCGKCHSTEWSNYKCSVCGNDIENSYIGETYIYNQLNDIVKGIF